MPRVEKLYGREWTTFSSCSKMWLWEVEWMRENEEEGRKKAYAKNTHCDQVGSWATVWLIPQIFSRSSSEQQWKLQEKSSCTHKHIQRMFGVGKPKVAELRDGAHFHSPKSSRLGVFPFFIVIFRITHTENWKSNGSTFLYTVEGVNSFLSIPHLVQRELTTAFVLFLIHSGCILGELKHEMEIFLKISQATH